MLDQNRFLKWLLISPKPQTEVTVRESGDGYVIRTMEMGIQRALRDWLKTATASTAFLVVVVIWLLPMAGLPGFGLLTKLLITLLPFVLFALRYPLSRDAGHFEARVDTAQRELRTANVNRKGEARADGVFRFEEIADLLIKRSHGKKSTQLSLCLRIIGREKLFPIASGQERALLAVHDRLKRDLSPIEQRTAGLAQNAERAGRSRHTAFPQLGPNEVTA